MIRVQSALTECVDCVVIDQIIEIFVIPHLNLLDFVRSAEAVEEVDERKASLDCSAVSDRGQIHNFLYGRLAEHCSSGLTACVHIRVIAEDVQSVGRNASCRYVEDTGKTLTGNLVQIRDHQKKTLGSSEGGSHSTCSKRTVYCTGSTGLSLHLGDLYGLAEDVLSSSCCPFINMFRHDG